MEKQENESWKRLSACLVRQVLVSQMHALIVHKRVSRTDDTVMVLFTTFHHRTIFYKERKQLKNGMKFYLDLKKARLDLLIKASKYLNSLSSVGFVCVDINCRLKIHFSNNNKSFFDSMDDLISKTEGFPNDI